MLSAATSRGRRGAPGPAVLVCHENRGLTPHIEDVARRFAKAGYVAWRWTCWRGRHGQLDRDVGPGRCHRPMRNAMSRLRRGFDYLAAQDRDGGRAPWWATASAAESPAGPTDLTGLKAPGFYGPAPGPDMVPAFKRRSFGVYAELDQRITGASRQSGTALAAKDTYELTVYPGADHAFHNDTGPRYVEAQATPPGPTRWPGSVSMSSRALGRPESAIRSGISLRLLPSALVSSSGFVLFVLEQQDRRLRSPGLGAPAGSLHRRGAPARSGPDRGRARGDQPCSDHHRYQHRAHGGHGNGDDPGRGDPLLGFAVRLQGPCGQVSRADRAGLDAGGEMVPGRPSSSWATRCFRRTWSTPGSTATGPRCRIRKGSSGSSWAPTCWGSGTSCSSSAPSSCSCAGTCPLAQANVLQAVLFTSFLWELGFHAWAPFFIFPFALLQALIFTRTKSLSYIVCRPPALRLRAVPGPDPRPQPRLDRHLHLLRTAGRTPTGSSDGRLSRSAAVWAARSGPGRSQPRRRPRRRGPGPAQQAGCTSP